MRESDLFWLVIFVLFIAGVYVAQAFERQRKRIKDLEQRIEKLESGRIPGNSRPD